MQGLIFAVTGLLVASFFTSTPDLFSLGRIILMLVILAVSFMVYVLFYMHGMENLKELGERRRVYKRTLWILAIIVGLLASDLLTNASENETWMIAFLFMAGLALWEFFYYMVGPLDAPSEKISETPRKKRE